MERFLRALMFLRVLPICFAQGTDPSPTSHSTKPDLVSEKVPK
jgi:hypothetical protein